MLVDPKETNRWMYADACTHAYTYICIHLHLYIHLKFHLIY
jgi:hypothetical protein